MAARKVGTAVELQVNKTNDGGRKASHRCPSRTGQKKGETMTAFGGTVLPRRADMRLPSVGGSLAGGTIW